MTRDSDMHFDGVSEETLRNEKARARELRKTRWWKIKISAATCHYCGARKKPADLTMDHIVPLARGGLSVKSNLVPACRTCNSRKKTMLPMEWDEYIEGIDQNSST